MPPHKQPPRFDLLCAASFGRRLYESSLTIELLKREGMQEQWRQFYEQEKLICVSLPVRVVEKYLVPMCRESYVHAVAHRRARALQTMLGLLLKDDMGSLDMSWMDGCSIYFNQHVPTWPSMRNLRVAILGKSASDELLKELCRTCEHLEELDVSGSSVSSVGFELFGVTDQNGVHGCPNLVRLRLRGCPSVEHWWLLRPLNDLKKLEELGYDDVSNVFLELFKRRRCRRAAKKSGYVACPPSPVFRIRGLSIYLCLPTDWSESENRMSRFRGGHRLGPVEVGFEGPYNFDRPLIRYSHRRGLSGHPSPENRVPVADAEGLLDFVTQSCPSIESFQLITDSQAHLVKLQRFLHLRKLSISVPEVSLGEGFASCINSKLTSLELRIRELPPDVLVAIGTTCESLTELRITVTGNSRLDGMYHTSSKGVFGNLEVLHYRTRGSRTVLKEEWLYLTSGPKNLTDLRIHSNVDYMTDQFWVDFLTNVNQLEHLAIVEVCSGVRRHFSIGKAFIEAFLLNCPKLKSVSGSFDPELLSDQDIGRIWEDMERKNFIFELKRF